MLIFLIDREILVLNPSVFTPKTFPCHEAALSKNSHKIPSHGTVCASILAETMPKSHYLVPISVAIDDTVIRMENLCKTLSWCVENPPNYLCMSLGTTNWLETAQLAQLTKELAAEGTKIFAACANNGHIAFPAAYPWVTGVRYHPGAAGLCREDDSPVGSNIVVGDFTTQVLEKIARENSFFESRTNSMAAPYALGKLLAEGLTVGDLPLWQKHDQIEKLDELPMPAVALQGPLEAMKELLALLQRESYQAALLTDRQGADWASMVLHATARDFPSWITPLAEAGILLLDRESSLASWCKYADYHVDLSNLGVQAGYTAILDFFGTEDDDEKNQY